MGGDAPSWNEARLLCVSRLAPTAESKRQLAQHHPEAAAVDMESSVLAQAAAAAQLPWGALRIIIDPLDSALPIDFNRCVNERGQTNRAKSAREIVSHPDRLPALVKFARWERRARQQLVRCSSELLEAISP